MKHLVPGQDDTRSANARVDTIIAIADRIVVDQLALVWHRNSVDLQFRRGTA